MFLSIYIKSFQTFLCCSNSDAAEYDDTHQDVPETDVSQQQQQPAGGWEKMQCLVNDDYFIDCRRDGDEVYIPFNFINKYFEVSSTIFIKLFIVTVSKFCVSFL